MARNRPDKPGSVMAMRRHPSMTQLLVQNVPRGLRDCFKAACRREGVSMHQVVTTYMAVFTAESNQRRNGG